MTEPFLKNIVIDGAVLYLTSTKIVDPKTDLATITKDYLGCAKSSITVVAKPTIREIEHMGKMERKTKGAERITGWEVSTEADILDLTKKTLEASLFVKSAEGTAPVEHDRYVPKMDIADSDYKHLVIVGKQQGTNVPVVCVVENTYNGEGLTIDYKDNDESAAKMKFDGHYETNSNVPPYQQYIIKTV